MPVRHLGTVALVSAATLLAVPALHAQSFSHACGGTQFFSCVTVNTATSGSSITFTVTNASNTAPANNPNSTFKLFGVGNTVTPTSISSTSTGSFETVCSVFINGCSDQSKSYLNTFNGTGFTSDSFFGLSALPPAPQNGLTDGSTASFTLVFANAIDASTFLNSYQFALHDIGGLTDACGSSKAAFSNTGTPTSQSQTPSMAGTCSGPPTTTTTPEPSSMALLGTGLVGLVPMIRRKRA